MKKNKKTDTELVCAGCGKEDASLEQTTQYGPQEEDL